MPRDALVRVLKMLGRPENTLPALSQLDDAELDRLCEAIERSCEQQERDLAAAFGRTLPAGLRERLWRIQS